jgi:uncharacterized protein (TIGR03086 family)
MIDLRPAADEMAALLTSLTDDDLTRPTPCRCTVATLVNHVAGLSLAFTAAARKDLGPMTSTPPSTDLPQTVPEGWRTTFPQAVEELARAWTEPAAWEGTTQAGGLEMPAAQGGVVALDELVLHAWDLAVATGRTSRPEEGALAVVEQFVGSFPPDPAARQGLFGMPVPVGPEASRFDRVLALAGRDPAWTPA